MTEMSHLSHKVAYTYLSDTTRQDQKRTFVQPVAGMLVIEPNANP